MSFDCDSTIHTYHNYCCLIKFSRHTQCFGPFCTTCLIWTMFISFLATTGVEACRTEGLQKTEVSMPLLCRKCFIRLPSICDVALYFWVLWFLCGSSLLRYSTKLMETQITEPAAKDMLFFVWSIDYFNDISFYFNFF